MDELTRWYKSTPVCTRYILTGAFIITVATNYGFILPTSLNWDATLFIKKFQLWRAVSAFLFQGKLSFHFLFNLYLIYHYSTELEKTAYTGRTADYITFLGFSVISLLMAGSLLGFPFLADALVMVLIYVWSQFNQNAIVNFMFGLQIKAMYFPWILLAYHVLTGYTPILEIIGVLIGYLYYYLEYIHPVTTGQRWLHTPKILYYYFPQRPPSYRNVTATTPRTSSRTDGRGTHQQISTSIHRYFTGSGHRLGTE
jgi:hypothetical protein